MQPFSPDELSQTLPHIAPVPGLRRGYPSPWYISLILFHLLASISASETSSRTAFCDLADAPVLDLPAVANLSLKAVAVGNRDITHVVAEGCDAKL
jgi:hypothetical protein